MREIREYRDAFAQDYCDVVCQAAKEGDLDPVRTDFHGTRYGYRELGCRCDRCRAWKAEQMRIYRAGRAERRFSGDVVTERLRQLRGES